MRAQYGKRRDYHKFRQDLVSHFKRYAAAEAERKWQQSTQKHTTQRGLVDREPVYDNCLLMYNANESRSRPYVSKPVLLAEGAEGTEKDGKESSSEASARQNLDSHRTNGDGGGVGVMEGVSLGAVDQHSPRPPPEEEDKEEDLSELEEEERRKAEEKEKGKEKENGQ